MNETFEEYESQPFNIGYTAATGLHTRMAQLTNYTNTRSWREENFHANKANEGSAGKK